MAARGAACTPRSAAAGAAGRRQRGAAQQRARPPPPPPPLQPLTAWSGSEALLRFVADAGGWVHPALVVASRGGGGGSGRGVFVTADVPPGPLAYVPCAACPTCGGAAAGAAGALWAPGGPLAALPPLASAEQLALHLLLRARAPGAAEHDAYVASLPRPQDGALASFPASWSDAQRAALGDEHLAAQFGAWRARNAAQHAALAPALGGAPPLALEEWLWANAMVLSRAFRWHDGADTSLQPLIDCVNHAPFQTRDGGADAARRNTMYCYVPAGADAAKWPCLPARAAAGGAAALTLLRPLKAGDEVLTSYAQEQRGGRLPAQAALARYGFLPAALSDADAPHDVHPADALNVALELRLAAGTADVAAGAPDAMRAVGAALGGDAAREEGAARAAAAAGDEAACIAALYRRGRGLALGRAALPHLLPPGGPGGAAAAAALEALRAGVAAGVGAAARGGAFAGGGAGAAAAFEAAAWHALAGEEPALLTPDEAIVAARAWV
jgi:hypothetical protein